MDGERYVAALLRGWREVDGVEPDRGDSVGPETERPRPGRGTALWLELSGGTGELSIAADGTTRLRAAAGPVLPAPSECALERAPWNPVFAVPREASDGGVALASSHAPLHLEVERKPFALRLVDHSGSPLVELCELAFASDGSTRIAMAAAPAEKFFGLGDEPGPLDRRGRRLLLCNREPRTSIGRTSPQVSIPFFLIHRTGGSDAGCCGVLLDSFAPARVDVASTREDRVVLETAGGGLDLMLFPGPRPRDVIARFTERVGRTPLPPLWALGHHQSRRASSSERAVRMLAAEIWRRGIPTDAVHLDIRHGTGGRVLGWNAKRFPDPRRLLEDLARRGLRVVSAVSPGVRLDPEWEVYRSGCARDVFCKREGGSIFTLPTRAGKAALPDFNRPDVRAWWGAAHASLCADGVAGISNLATEPSGWRAVIRSGRRMLPFRKRNRPRVVQADPAESKGAIPLEPARNLYGLQHARATREGLESIGRERRPFVLTRSGTTGIQRYAALSAGRDSGRWSHLGQSIPLLLNLSLSGVAFCGSDIGGAFRSWAPELFARWIQLGALYPFVRTRSTRAARRRESWRSGRRVERVAHEAIALRMRLLPYLYGLLREAEETGAPVWRPLFFEFPEDAEAAEIEDQLMLGPALLAAPVVERGARERDVYLPPGTWTAWHDDARYVGPRRLTVPAPLERLPLFVRAGSVIPMQSGRSRAGTAAAESCIFAVYPGADFAGALMEDDGETTAYRGGVSGRTSLRLWCRAGGRLRLEIGRREGPFRVPERPLRVEVHSCPPPQAVNLDGARVPARAEPPGWTARDGTVNVRLVDRGAGASIEIDPAP